MCYRIIVIKRRKVFQIVYIIWLLISTILSLLSLISFYPNYHDAYFPLIIDITTVLLFLPFYFIFFYGVVLHLFVNQVPSNKITKFIFIILYLTVFLYSIKFLDFYTFEIRFIISFIGATIGTLHYVITGIIYKKSYK